MGLAILLVLFYHIYISTSVSLIPLMSPIGYCGVDIFLFLSGYGLCYGFARSHSVITFYKRRLIRLIPSYCIVIIISSLIFEPFSLFEIVTRIFGIGYYLPVCGMTSFDWYVPTMYLLYLLFPIIYVVITNDLRMWKIILVFALIPALIKICGLPLPLNNLTLARIPVFVIGAITGTLSIKKIYIPHKVLFLCSFISILGVIMMMYVVDKYTHDFLWSTMIYWLPFMIITPGLCLILTWSIEKVPCCIKNTLAFLGSISLEIYLAHILIQKSYFDWILGFNPLGLHISSIISGIIFILISILLGYSLWYCVKLLMKSMTCPCISQNN